MRKDKKKGHRKKGSTSRLLAVAGAVVAGVCLFLSVAADRSSDAAPAAPPEADSGLEAAGWMDRALEKLWPSLGLAESDIEREGVSILEWEDGGWELQVIHAHLPSDADFSEVAGALERISLEEGRQVHLYFGAPQKDLLPVDIRVEGFLTHRILFQKKEEQIASQRLALSPVRPKIALIMDDMGNTYAPIKSIFDIGKPFTLSILPHRPFSRRILDEARSHGLEVMLHMPMEPRAYPEKKPGAGALMVSMTGEEVVRTVTAGLDDLPEIVGVNNHMGSRFMEDQEKIERFMAVLASRGLYFVDSLTTPRSVGYQLAKRAGVPTLRRDIFLDVYRNEKGVRKQFEKALRLSRRLGQVVVICHPYPVTLELLPELFYEAEFQGFEWVTVSGLLFPEKDETGTVTYLKDKDQ